MSAGVPRDEGLKTVTDEALVLRAQQGEAQATNELFSRYQQKAYTIAYYLCSGQSDEAQDLVQDAFLKVFRNLKGYKRHASFYTWFYRIVVNTYLDTIKRRTRWERLCSFRLRGTSEDHADQMGEAQSAQPTPLTIYSGNALQQELEQALRSLPAMQRLVFQLKVLEGMPIADIAHITGTAAGTVKSHLFRATHALRTLLKGWDTP
jgi:RNA polymerase sigma-70 factor (ECF subfamily)